MFKKSLLILLAAACVAQVRATDDPETEIILRGPYAYVINHSNTPLQLQVFDVNANPAVPVNVAANPVVPAAAAQQQQQQEQEAEKSSDNNDNENNE
jgi:hypothetical protein